MPKHTIVDIARRAGVGVGTASRALNNAPDVSPATRERVLAAAAELNYHPSAVARRLQGKRTNTIAYVPEVGEQPAVDMLFKDFIAILANSCARHDLDLLIHPLTNGRDYTRDFEQLLRGRRADGLILADTRVQDERVAYLAQQALPFITFGRTICDCAYSYVDVDSQAGTRAATLHLIERGHQRIGFLGLPLDYSYANHRYDGYYGALLSRQITPDPDLVVTNLVNETGARTAVRSMLLMPAPPSAFVAASDLLAIYALRVVEDFGFHVGRDIAIVGFDDLLLAQHTNPPLTTIRQPFDQVCDVLIDKLLQVIEGDPAEVHQALVEPELIIRRSS
jgi:LacI family transcriptional regulator